MKNHLKDFRVVVSWAETGTVSVKAADIDSAIERVDIGLPSGEYVDEPFQVMGIPMAVTVTCER